MSLLLLLGRQFIAKTTKHRRNDNLERKTLQIHISGASELFLLQKSSMLP
jgi:hypothetical protein